MAIKLSKKEEKKTLKKIWDVFWYARMARMTFMERYESSMRGYHNKTLSDKDKQLILQRGQSDVSINYMRIYLRKMKSALINKKPIWRSFSATNDMESSFLADAVLNGNFRSSVGHLQVSDIIKNGLVGGVGLFSNYIDYRANDGLGYALFKSLPVNYFYPDWRSTNPCPMLDSGFQIVSYTVPTLAAMKMMPERADDIRKLSTSKDEYETLVQDDSLVVGQWPEPYTTDFVRLLTYYTVEEQQIWEIEDLDSGEKFQVNEDIEIGIPFAFDKRKVTRLTLVKYDCVYGMGEDDGIVYDVTKYPFSEFLISQFIDEFTGHPYGYGEIYFLESLQRYLDKSLRVALQQESFNSNPGMIVDPGTFDNIDRVRQQMSLPGFVVEGDLEKEPFLKRPQPGQSGFYNIVQYAKNALDDSTGGMFTQADATGNATEAAYLTENGMKEGNMIMQSFQSSMEYAGKSNLKLSRFHYKFPMLLRFLDSENRARAISLNQTHVDENGELKRYDLSDLDMDISLTLRSDSGSAKMHKMRQITEAMQRAPAEVASLLFLEWIKAAEFDPVVVEEAKARMDILPQLQQMIQQMGEQLQALETEKAGLEKIAESADRKAVRAAYDAELEKQLIRFRAELEKAEAIFQNNLKSQEAIQKAIAKGKPDEPRKPETTTASS